MINILLEGYEINAPWLYDDLKKYILPNQLIAVIAFSFRDNEVKNLKDWDSLYSKEKVFIIMALSTALPPTEYRKIILHLLIILRIQRNLPYKKYKRQIFFISPEVALTE